VNGRLGVRRMFRRYVPAILLVLAIASYGAFLLAAHAAATSADVRPGYLQLFGSAAFDRRNALLDRRSGSIEIGRRGKSSASGQWVLGPIDERMAPGTKIPSEEIFVTGLNFSLYRQTSYATVTLDGKQVEVLRPARTKPEDSDAFPEGTVALQPIDIPPGFEMGFRFNVPANADCVTRACTLGIHVANGVWVVRRVGVMFTTEAPPAAALWSPRGAGWKIGFVAAGLAILSHLLLSLRIRVTGNSRAGERRAT